MKHFVVLTSVHGETPIIEKIRSSTNELGWNCIVSGDTTSTPIKSEGNFDFFSIQQQLDSQFQYAKKAPVRNYCRKNLAYLRAIELGAEVIIEIDDDNFPVDGFFSERKDRIETKAVNLPGYVNVYSYFTDEEHIWPRGFSLGDLKRELPAYSDLESETVFSPVQNGMVDGDPDVDAIYRLLYEMPFDFEHKDRQIALKKGAWCSFNTQNTTFFKGFFPIMYQPATPMFREADIVRSMVITRILWENDAHVMFHSSNVIQERNDHDIILDLREEVRLYSFVKEISTKLEKLNLASGPEAFYDNMTKCYEVFKPYGIIDAKENAYIDAWVTDLSMVL